MTDFAWTFNNDHNNISDAVQQNQSTGSSSYAAPLRNVTWPFSDVHGGIYSANAFPSPIIRINTFHISNTTSSERKKFYAN